MVSYQAEAARLPEEKDPSSLKEAKHPYRCAFMISRYEFEILTYVERKGRVADSARETATELCLSWTTAAETTECL